MKRFLILSCLSFICFSVVCQDENQIKVRYFNGSINGNGVYHTVGLQVSSSLVKHPNALEPIFEATLSGQEPKVHYKKKFVLFFTIQNISKHDVAIYHWAFKAVCPIDNMGRSFNASSMVPLVTPYIPSDIYIILKPGERKEFYSAETDFYWCLPQNKIDLLHNPEYFQALITCASLDSTSIEVNPNQKLGSFQPPSSTPEVIAGDLDPQLELIIRKHNNLIEKNENDKAELLKSHLLEITKLAYPAQVELVVSKLSFQQSTSISNPVERSTLSFNENIREASSYCVQLERGATLTSLDSSAVLVLYNLAINGNFSVNADFYKGRCRDCLTVQFIDKTTSKTYIAVSGTVNRTGKRITVNVTVQEDFEVEGDGASYKVTGNIICK